MKTRMGSSEFGEDSKPSADVLDLGFRMTAKNRHFFREQIQRQLQELEARIGLGKQDVRTVETRKAFDGLSLEEEERGV